MQKKELFFIICPRATENIMSNRRNFSSSHRFSRDFSQDTSKSTTGAQSEQGSFRSSSFGSAWGRPNSDSHPQASGGDGWGRPQHAPAAASDGWGRSSFQRPPAAVGGGWGSRIASTEASRQQHQPPQQAESEQEQPCQTSAPAEEYSFDSVRHAFKEKYVISFQDDLPVIEQNVQNYITANPLKYGQPIKLAIERALFKIHEELQSKLRKRIPEKDSHSRSLTMQEEFALNLKKTLSSYGLTSADGVNQFVAEYMRKPLSDHVFLDEIDKDTGNPMCLRSSQACTDQHMYHAIHTYLLSLNLSLILRDNFGFVDGKMPTQLFRQLPHHIRNLIKHAKSDDRQIMNGFLMIYPPENVAFKLKKKLLESLITPSQQSYSVHFVSLTSKGLPTTGDVCLVIPSEIFTQTKSEKDASHARVITQKPVMSQYRTAGNRGTILLGMYEVLDWRKHNMQCSSNGTNMRLLMKNFCTILSSNYGTIPLVVEDEPQMTVSKQLPEDTFFPIHDDTSSAGGGWGAAAPY